jgi:hypothetical protein
MPDDHHGRDPSQILNLANHCSDSFSSGSITAHILA